MTVAEEKQPSSAEISAWLSGKPVTLVQSSPLSFVLCLPSVVCNIIAQVFKAMKQWAITGSSWEKHSPGPYVAVLLLLLSPNRSTWFPCSFFPRGTERMSSCKGNTWPPDATWSHFSIMFPRSSRVTPPRLFTSKQKRGRKRENKLYFLTGSLNIALRCWTEATLFWFNSVIKHWWKGPGCRTTLAPSDSRSAPLPGSVRLGATQSTQQRKVAQRAEGKRMSSCLLSFKSLDLYGNKRN